jgi:fatty acid desaturase
MHHTHTNVLGKDRDIGYGILRMSDDQPWRPRDLGNPVYATLLALLFQWGVALHDVEIERIQAGEIELKDKQDILRAVWHKGRRQVLKDYAAFPLLAGPAAPFVAAGNLTANVTRNLWSFMIIFCGHFPAGTHEFSEEEVEDESRGAWYLRQMLGSANLTGSRLFHILSGNLSHQIEHHLFPDIPAHRYAEIAVEVREITERYGLPYNTGPLHKQFGSVVKKIFRLALPGGSRGAADAPAAAGPAFDVPEPELALVA